MTQFAVSIPLLWWSSAGSTIFYLVSVSAFVVIGHAAISTSRFYSTETSPLQGQSLMPITVVEPPIQHAFEEEP